MRLGLLGYFLRKALGNLRLNPFVSLVTLSTIAISLLILGLFALIYLNLQQFLEHWGDELHLTAYLEDNLSPEEAGKLQRQVRSWQAVAGVTYVSKGEALARFRSQLGGEAGILSGLRQNPLPASLELKLRPEAGRRADIESLARRLQGLRGVGEVQYGKKWVARLRIFAEVTKLVGITIGGLLLLATIFVVSNTVKLTFYSRLEELEIMRLVGATDFFIKAPFFIEGLLHGLGGALLAAGGLLALALLLFSHLHLPLGFVLLGGPVPAGPLLAGFLGLGMMLGMLGSMVSLRRFLRP